MPATYADLKFEQGATFELVVEVHNPDKTLKNLTGYTGRMQVRPTKESTTIYVNLTTEITIPVPANGQVVITVPSSVTAAYTWGAGYYDLEIFTGGGVVHRILEGYAELSLEVTR